MANVIAADAARGDLAARLGALKQTKLYDLAAATPMIAWTCFCAARQVPWLVHDFAASDFGSAGLLFYARMASRSASVLFLGFLLVLFAIRKTPRHKAPGVVPRVAAVGGTYLGVALMLLPMPPLGWAPLFVSALLVLGGTVFALYAIASLGRSLSVMAEARALVTSGPYRLIRHPLYLGEAVMLVGIAIQYVSWMALALLAVQLACQVQRMKYEEGVLEQAFPEYGAYRARTARLIPYVY